MLIVKVANILLFFSHLGFFGHSKSTSCSENVYYNLDAASQNPLCVKSLFLGDLQEAPDLCSFKNLETLEIKNFSFEQFSSELGCLKKLKHLILAYGKLKSISLDMKSLTNLETFSVAHNDIEALSKASLVLPNSLTTINFSNNPITKVDSEIFADLNNLRRVSIYESATTDCQIDEETKKKIKSNLPPNCQLWLSSKSPYK